MENELKSMKIQLGGKNGGVALISENDYEMINKYHWCKDKQGYVRAIVDGKPMRMHRFIMLAKKNELVDHINGIRHDNRKNNLRILSGTEKTHINASNRGICKSKQSSKYRGVFFNKTKNKFYVQITIKGNKHNLGYYDNEIDAAEKFDLYVTHNNLDYIQLNFPDNKDNYIKQEYKFNKKENKKFDYYGIGKSKKGYFCCVMSNGKRHYLGRSNDLIQCAKTYDKYIYDNMIPHKKLNFPENYPNYDPDCEIKIKYE